VATPSRLILVYVCLALLTVATPSRLTLVYVALCWPGLWRFVRSHVLTTSSPRLTHRYFSSEIYFIAAVGIQLLMLVGTLPILYLKPQTGHHHPAPPSPPQKPQKPTSASAVVPTPSKPLTGPPAKRRPPPVFSGGKDDSKRWRADEREPLLKKSSPLVPAGDMSINAAPVYEDELDTREGESGSRRPVSASQPAYINRDGLLLCIVCFMVYGMTYAL
jgi:hypothetical protein